MPKLPTYTLEYEERKERWELQKDSNDKVVKTFATKDDATRRGALRKAVGPEGGSVRIQKQSGRYQEERT